MRLWPDGKADVSIVGTRAGVHRFAARLAASSRPLHGARATPTPPPRRLLTEAQADALRAAVRAGYYRIPRPLTLHDLADRLGVTAASLSERLRRAEGRVLTRYAEQATLPSHDGRDGPPDGSPPGRQG